MGGLVVWCCMSPQGVGGVLTVHERWSPPCASYYQLGEIARVRFDPWAVPTERPYDFWTHLPRRSAPPCAHHRRPLGDESPAYRRTPHHDRHGLRASPPRRLVSRVYAGGGLCVGRR